MVMNNHIIYSPTNPVSTETNTFQLMYQMKLSSAMRALKMLGFLMQYDYIHLKYTVFYKNKKWNNWILLSKISTVG